MKRDRVRRWIVKNPGWRILSLTLAIVIWMNVATEPEMSALISAPVQFRDPPDGIEVTTRAAESVQVEARGSSGQLRDLANSRPAITLDFSRVHEPGDRTFTITRAETNLPRAVEFLRASPAQIRFHFERSEHRHVPVTVLFHGKPPKGLSLQSFSVQPSTEEIAGPEAEVRKVKEAFTNNIDLAAVNVLKPVAKVDLYLQDTQVRFISEPRVTVTMVLK